MLRSLMIAAATLCLGAGAASAQSEPPPALSTAHDLAQTCRTDAAVCYGFITGSAQLYQIMVAADTIKPIACYQRTPTLEDVRATFLAWSDAHPDKGSDKAIDGLWLAAAQKWPCGRP